MLEKTSENKFSENIVKYKIFYNSYIFRRKQINKKSTTKNFEKFLKIS